MYKVFAAVLSNLILILLCSCGESSSTAKERLLDSDPAQNTASSTTWLMELMEKEPLTEQGYLALVPENLQGYPLQMKEPQRGLNGFIAFYGNEQGHEHPGLKLEVIDGAGQVQFQHVNAVYKMLENVRSESGDDFESQIKDYKGERILFVKKIKNKEENFQLEYLQNQRYHIGIIGNLVKPDVIYGAFEELQSNQFPQ
ncbi:hypothetical protein ACPUEN_05895 [Algoriphagus yeomjeoni]|uniref:hypothetical protein n=1 Tax=Algoriphagus yeomjeoni TaxID=291403 RepID=UPI003CE5C5F0